MITEFVLALPLVLLLILGVVETAFVGVRSIVAGHAAFRAARVAAVYQREYAGAELYAMLSPALFRGGWIDPDSPADEIRIGVAANPLVRIRALDPALTIRRASPIAPALPDGLSDAVLRGGDVPSPYCREGARYRVCGYPE